MDLRYNLLAATRRADLEREAEAHRLADLVARCRRLLLGFLPVTRPCQPCASC